MKTAVVGAGSWGTALAMVLCSNGHSVTLWDRNAERLAEIKALSENRRYLAGVRLPDSLNYEPDAEKALSSSELAVFAVPAQHFAENYSAAEGFMPKDSIAVNVAKGIDCKSLKRLSELAFEIDPSRPFAVLSGPSHAEEVSRGLPAAVVAASQKLETAKAVQDAFMNPVFRVYTSVDLTGVELGGALKNVIALGAGMSDGLGLGDNARAALITRGISEMMKLGIALGADPATFSGLSGIGDLIVTCGSVHSRNRRCGVLIGQGASPEKAVEEVGMVVEGIYTTEAVCELAARLGAEMPISRAIKDIVDGKYDAREAAHRLMTRSRKHENGETAEL